MRVASAPLIFVLVAGCAYIGELAGGGSPPVVAALEVHNRTEMAITYVAADGEHLEVPACAHAADADFRIDTVRVGANEWYVRSFGVGSDLAGQAVYVIEVADGSASGVPQLGPVPEPLPTCEGDPEYQEGVPLSG